jgi:hypothetical protein
MSRNLTTRRGAAFIVAVSATVAGAAVGVPSAFATTTVVTPEITKATTLIVAADESSTTGTGTTATPVTIKLVGKGLDAVTTADVSSTVVSGTRCHSLPAAFDATKKTVTITVPTHVAADALASPPVLETLAGCPATVGTTGETVTLYKPDGDDVDTDPDVVATKAAVFSFVTRVKPVTEATYSLGADGAIGGGDDVVGVDPAYLVNSAKLPAQSRSFDLNAVGGQVVRIDADPSTPFTKKVAVSVKVGDKPVKLSATNKLTDSNTYVTVKLPKFAAAATALKFSITDKGLTGDYFTSKLNVKVTPLVTGVSPNFGAYVAASADGDNVQIKGSGFGTTPTAATIGVTICGEAAPLATGTTVKAASDKLITVVAPKWNTGLTGPGAQVCPVVVTVASNASSLNGTSVYTYVTD